MDKPEISYEKKEGKEIIMYEATKITSKCGTSCHVILPANLLGKRVRIIFQEDSNE